jgi:hypothetical protein
MIVATIAATTAVAKVATVVKTLVVVAAVSAVVADAVVAAALVALLAAGAICRPRNTLHRKVAAPNRVATHVGIHAATTSAIRARIAARNPAASSLAAPKNAASIIAVRKHHATAVLRRARQVSMPPKSPSSSRANRSLNIAASLPHLPLLP